MVILFAHGNKNEGNWGELEAFRALQARKAHLVSALFLVVSECFQRLLWSYGGETRIRTLDTLPVYTLSKRAPSATRPSLRGLAGFFESNTVGSSLEGGKPSQRPKELEQECSVSSSLTISTPPQPPLHQVAP